MHSWLEKNPQSYNKSLQIFISECNDEIPVKYPMEHQVKFFID